MGKPFLHPKEVQMLFTIYPSTSQRECQDLAEFVRKVLGPYSMNVTTATLLCSASLCQGKGRCVRQNPESSAYLHLPPPAALTPPSPSPSEVVEKETEKVRECAFKEDVKMYPFQIYKALYTLILLNCSDH